MCDFITQEAGVTHDSDVFFLGIVPDSSSAFISDKSMNDLLMRSQVEGQYAYMSHKEHLKD